MSKTLLSLLLVTFLVCFIHSDEVSFKISQITGTETFFCAHDFFHTLTGKTGKQFIYNLHGFASNNANIRSVQLWSCSNENFVKKAQFKCLEELPDRNDCQMVYSWDPTSDLTLRLPRGVAFVTGENEDLNKMIVVARFATPPTAEDAGVTITYNTTEPQYEAGVMTVGVKPSSVSLPANSSNVEMANNCENTCALLGDWYIFSATPLMHSLGKTIQAAYYKEGLLKRFFVRDTDYGSSPDSTILFIDEPTNDYSPNEKVKIAKSDRFSVECTFDTTSVKTTTHGGNNGTGSEACLTYLNFYPRGSGIKSCLDGKCINKSGDADYYTNIIVNYVALALASMLIGTIIGFALHMLLMAAQKWVSNNSGRFTKKHFVSFKWLNPVWWFKPFEEEELEDDEETKRLTDEGDLDDLAAP